MLTAAHCLAAVSHQSTSRDQLVPSREMRLAVTSGSNLQAPTREVDVVLARVHPRFDPRSLEYDAALLWLSEDMDGAIEPGVDDVEAGECGVVAGWGETHESLQCVPRLSWARMHVAPDDVCARQRSGCVVANPRAMFAAGGDAARCPEFPRAAVHKGDSGSGFVVSRSGGLQLCGIVSWSASAVGAPHVLTRTFALLDWLDSEMTG